MAVVGAPLAPTNVGEMGALKGWPPPEKGFDTQGNWTHTYRIWTCHGNTDSGNVNRGVVRIERKVGGDKSRFTLHALQRVVHTGDLVHALEAQIVCRADEIATPERWSLSSRFFEPGGRERKDLACTKQGAPEKAGRATSDWCLFEAIQRLPFRKGGSPAFDLLEGLTMSRTGQRILYGRRETYRQNGKALTLHRFYQIGHGTLPYEYWLDEDHRLLLVCSHDKAFILDPDADSKVRWRSKTPARKAASK